MELDITLEYCINCDRQLYTDQSGNLFCLVCDHTAIEKETAKN